MSDPNTSPGVLLVAGVELPAIDARLDPVAAVEGFVELALEADPCEPRVELKPAPAWRSLAEPDPAAAFFELALEADPCEPRVELEPAPAWRLAVEPDGLADPALPFCAMELELVLVFVFGFRPAIRPGIRGFVGEPGGGRPPVAAGRWEFVSPVPARSVPVPVAPGWAPEAPTPELPGPLSIGRTF